MCVCGGGEGGGTLPGGQTLEVRPLLKPLSSPVFRSGTHAVMGQAPQSAAGFLPGPH